MFVSQIRTRLLTPIPTPCAVATIAPFGDRSAALISRLSLVKDSVRSQASDARRTAIEIITRRQGIVVGAARLQGTTEPRSRPSINLAMSESNSGGFRTTPPLRDARSRMLSGSAAGSGIFAPLTAIGTTRTFLLRKAVSISMRTR